MDKSLNEHIEVYRQQLEQGDIQIAYERLRKYVLNLRAHFHKALSDKYSFGNVSPGYMDFTYFPFFDESLRSRKLRFGLVLNHQKLRFELWLIGQNEQVQSRFWQLLKNSKWNEGRREMPRYSVLEAVVCDAPDFDNLDALTVEIEQRSVRIAEEIQDFIRDLK